MTQGLFPEFPNPKTQNPKYWKDPNLETLNPKKSINPETKNYLKLAGTGGSSPVKKI